MKAFVGVGLVIAIVVVMLFGSYNGLVSASESVDNQWAQVESQYQRRLDLIPNLVESVKGVMGQEQKVFGDIAEARTRYSGATATSDKAAAAGELEGALSRLLVIMENYPQLKSSDTVADLMTQLEGTENRVSVERQRYNDTVQAYNLKTKRLPGAWFAAMFGFDEKAYFEADVEAATAPKVDLAI